MCGFFRLTDGFFRVHLGFHVGVSYQDIFKALSFLWVAPRVFRVSLRIHTHKRIRLSFSDSLRFRLAIL